MMRRTRTHLFLTAGAVALILSVCLAPGGAAEIDGLIIDRTQTRIGYEFYCTFCLGWEAPVLERTPDYSLNIVERASPQWGSWVRVLVNDAVVYQKVLQPRQGDIEDEARGAIAATARYLVDEFLARERMLDEDMSASGI